MKPVGCRVNRSTTTYTAGTLGGRLMVAKDSESTDTDLIQPLSASGSACGVATFPSRFQRLVSRFLHSAPRLPIPARGRETRNGTDRRQHLPSINPCPHRPTTAWESPPRPQARPIHQASRFTLDLQLQKSPTLGPWSPLTGFSVTPYPQSGSLFIEIPATNTPPYFFRVIAE